MRKIIFDLDDTLYISKELREKRNKEIIKFLGDNLSKYTELKRKYNTIECFNRLGFSKEEFYNLIETVPINLNRDEKLVKIFSRLKKHYNIIILSNNSKKIVKNTIEKLGIIHLIDSYYGGNDFPVLKPNKKCFSMVERNDIVIGNDYEKDLKIPKEMGAITILVNEEANNNVSFTIKSIYEIDKIL